MEPPASPLHPTPALAFMTEVGRAGPNAGPRMLRDRYYRGDLTVDDLRRVITSVWMLSDAPASVIGVEAWVRLFRAAGFVTDDDDRPASTGPVTAYRGATWGRRRGMSWTTDLARARRFAGAGLVFRSTVPAPAVLARIGMEGGRDEVEVVVEPALLPPVRRTAIVPRLEEA